MKQSIFDIQISPMEEGTQPYMITIMTEDINFSMNQYQRNRPALEWKIVQRPLDM